MRRALRVVIWLVVLTACAGAGAFIASRTDPFPPGVEDPEAESTGSAPSEAPATSWTGTGLLRSTHRLFVGGSCRTNWLVSVYVEAVQGTVQGTGSARLTGDLVCDFPTAQVQAERFTFDVTGDDLGATLRLRFTEVAREPAGSIDLGALAPLLERTRLDLWVGGGRAAGSIERRSSDGERGELVIRGRVVLTQQP